MHKQFLLESNYTISSETMINSFDRKIISQLYQPIIGYQAVALYFTLYSEVEIDRIYTSQSSLIRLTRIMSIDINQLGYSFNFLEALGLVKTFYKKNNGIETYHFEIYSPNSPSQFFNNPLLVSRLKDALQEKDYHRTKMYFTHRSFDYNDYEEISKKYVDVFSLTCNMNDVVDDKFREYRYAKIKSDIDSDLLKEVLKKNNLHLILLDKNKKNYLEMLMLEFNLDINSLANSMINCAQNNTVELSELEKYLVLKRKIDNSKVELERVYLASEKGATIYEVTSVYDYLKKSFPNIKVTLSSLKKIEASMKEYPLSNGVYNVMIEYVIKEMKTLNISYLKVMAQQWYNLNIQSVDQGLKKIGDIKNNKKKGKVFNHKQKVIGENDLWYDKTEEINNDTDINEISEWLKSR